MDGEAQQGPLRTPRNPPPSHPNPSQVGHDIERYPAMHSLDGGGHGGSDRAWEPSHGTSGGGSDRAWELSHGRHGAFMNNGTRRPFPTPGFLPPSNPNPSKVGDGLIIQGDRGGRTPAAVPGGVAAAGAGVPKAPLAELRELSSNSAARSGFPSNKCARPVQAQIIHPNILYPTHQLRTALVCYY